MRTFITVILAITFMVGCATAQQKNAVRNNNDDSKAVAVPVVEATTISISGTLADYNGKAVLEGFVMLKNNPRLCTMTDGQGRFKIIGKAYSLPDTLLASWAGCETAEVAITKANVKNLAVQLKAEDREYTKIEVGCAILATDRGAHKKAKVTKKLRATSRKLTADEQVCIKAYKAFLKDKGEAIIKKILAGEELASNEAKYRNMLHAEICLRAGYGELFKAPKKNKGKKAEPEKNPYFAYGRPLIERAKKIMAKGYKGETLTAEDIETLRFFRAIQGVYHPGNDGVMRGEYAGFKHHANNMIPYPVNGKKLHDCSFFEFDKVIKSPDFSNYSSLSLTEFIRLESLADFFTRFAGVKIDDKGLLAPKTKAQMQASRWKKHEQMITMDEIVESAKKPVAVFYQIFEDRTFPSRAARYAEYLRRAYRDQIEVIIVHQPSPLHGDMYIEELRYFGQNTGANPLSGLNTRLGEEDNTPLRHARTVKIATMENPIISGPIYLENESLHYTFFGVKKKGFGHLPMLLDINGIKSFGYDNHQALNFSISEQYNKPSPFSKSYAHMWSPYAIYERELRALVANNGKYDSAKMGQSFHLTYPTRHFSPHDQYVFKSYDKKTGILHASWVKPKASKNNGTIRGHYPIIDYFDDPEPGVEFRFKISPDTRIILSKKNGKAFWLSKEMLAKLQAEHKYRGFWADYYEGVSRSVSTVDDFRPGDRFFADYVIDDKQTKPRRRLCDELIRPDEKKKIDLEKSDILPGFSMDKYLGKVLDTVRIHNFYDSRGMASNQTPTMGSLMPLYGRIAKIEGKIMTVKINAEEVKEMHGYKFWKQDAKIANSKRSLQSYARNTVPVIMRWAEGSDEDRTYRFVLDRAVRVTRNGEYENITTKNLKVGDYVFVEYHSFYEKLHQGKCLIYPETIMSSSPVK